MTQPHNVVRFCAGPRPARPALAPTTRLGFNRCPDPHPLIRANTSQTSKTSRSRIREPIFFAIHRLADTPPLAPLRPNPHSARGTAIRSPSRFRPIEAFGRRPPEPVAPPSAACPRRRQLSPKAAIGTVNAVQQSAWVGASPQCPGPARSRCRPAAASGAELLTVPSTFGR
jgi:hypothetical protein